MSRITKQIAENVSTKLTENKANEIKQLQDNLKDKFTEIYCNNLPKETLELHLKFPSFLKTRNQFQLHGNGFNFDQIFANKDLPSKMNSNTFSPNEKESEILIKLINEISSKKSELEKLKREITALVFNLRTYAKVKLEFPEAFPFLPESTTTAVMVNISDIREKLK